MRELTYIRGTPVLSTDIISGNIVVTRHDYVLSVSHYKLLVNLLLLYTFFKEVISEKTTTKK